MESARSAAERIHSSGVANVIVTMGSDGVLLFNAQSSLHIPGITVTPVDTTAAGDVFCGALAVGIAEGMRLEESIRFANSAAAISVTRLGAQSSAPFRNEVRTT